MSNPGFGVTRIKRANCQLIQQVMIVSSYKGIKPFVLFLILLTGMVFWLKAVVVPEAVNFPFDTHSLPFYHWTGEFLYDLPILSVIAGFLLSLILGSLLVRLNTTYFFINQRTYLPALFFILGSSIFVSLQRVNPVLLASLFLMVAIDRMFGTYKNSKTSFQYFDAGILIGLGSLFYVNLIFYLPVLWIGMVILRPFVWREWLVTIFGFTTPLALTIAIHYLIQGEIMSLISNFMENLTEPYHFGGFNHSHLLSFSFLGLMILVCSLYMIRAYSGKKISSRKYLKIMLWIFIITLIIYFFAPSASVELIFILFIPLSYLFTNFFISIRSPWLCDILFVLFLASIVVVQVL